MPIWSSAGLAVRAVVTQDGYRTEYGNAGMVAQSYRVVFYEGHVLADEHRESLRRITFRPQFQIAASVVIHLGVPSGRRLVHNYFGQPDEPRYVVVSKQTTCLLESTV